MVDLSKQKVGFLDSLKGTHAKTTEKIVKDFTHNDIETTFFDLDKGLQQSSSLAKATTQQEAKAGVGELIANMKKTAAQGLRQFQEEGVTTANVSAGVNVRMVAEKVIENPNLKLKNQDEAEKLVKDGMKANKKIIDEADKELNAAVKGFSGVIVMATGNQAKDNYKNKKAMKKDIENVENLLMQDEKNVLNVGASEEAGKKGKRAKYASMSKKTSLVASGKTKSVDGKDEEGTSFSTPRITAMVTNQQAEELAKGKSLEDASRSAVKAVKKQGEGSKNRKSFEEGDGFISDDKIRQSQQKAAQASAKLQGEKSGKPVESDQPPAEGQVSPPAVASLPTAGKEFTDTLSFRAAKAG